MFEDRAYSLRSLAARLRRSKREWFKYKALNELSRALENEFETDFYFRNDRSSL